MTPFHSVRFAYSLSTPMIYSTNINCSKGFPPSALLIAPKLKKVPLNFRFNGTFYFKGLYRTFSVFLLPKLLLFCGYFFDRRQKQSF